MGPSPFLWFMHANQRLLDQISKSLWVPVFACWFVNENRVLRSRMTLVYCSKPSSVVLCLKKKDFSFRITSLYGSQTSPVDLWMQKSVNRSRLTLVYCSQPQSVVLSTQNSDFCVRINSLYGSQPSFVAFACITTWLASESLVSMGPRPHMSFCAIKTMWLASELLVSMCPRLHLCLLYANSDFRSRITSLYGSQISPIVFFIRNSAFSTELQVSICPSPHLWFCAFATATLWPELIVSMGPRTHLSFCACKTAWLAPGILVSIGPRPHLSFCACKTTWLASE